VDSSDGPSEDLATGSTRVDCWRYNLDHPSTVDRPAYEDDSLSSSSRSESPSSSSSTISNLPGTLYLNGYRFIHLRRGFIDGWAADSAQIIRLEEEFLGTKRRDYPAGKPLPLWRRYGTQHASVIEFLVSAMSGCPICVRIRSAVANMSNAELEGSSPFDTGFTTYGIYYFPEYGTAWVIFHLGLPHNHRGLQFDPQQTILHLLCRPHNCKCSKKAGLPPASYSLRSDMEWHRNLSPRFQDRIPSSFSTANFDIAAEWIQDCDKTHSCHHIASNSYFPTRLLSIGDAGDPTIRLVTTKMLPRDRYCTLSYCWGSGVPVKLLSHLLAEFEQGIPITSLPKTLQEAVDVSRILRVKYIWIDALCIIQDSRGDWNREATTMADIYSNSYCNLAATSSKDCDGGLIKARNPDDLKPTLVQTHWEDIESETLHLIDTEIVVKDVDKAPLNRRGWVLQERYLSPRTLHFGRNQLFWECYQGISSEAYPSGFLSGCFMMLPKKDLAAFNLGASQTDSQHSGHSQAVYDYWCSLVEVFTLCSLTQQDDKLPAISGLARRIASLTSDEYVVGLWKAKLPSQLLWAPEKNPGSRLETYVGPSWSWVSIDGGVSAGNREKPEEGPVPLIGDLSPTINYETDDIYSRVVSAVLRVRARLYPAMLEPYGIGWNGMKLKFDDDELNPGEYAKPIQLDEEIRTGNNLAYCVPVLLHDRSLDCLVLVATGNARGEYKRVGTYPTSHEEDVSIMGRGVKPYRNDPELYEEDGRIAII
jgi:hypothetical protein